MSTVWFVKTTADANQRKRGDVHEFKVACDKCGLSKWVPRAGIWQRHEGCLRGIFYLVAKEGKKK